MLSTLNKTHQDYFNNLLTCSITNYSDYRAGASLLFLFPYYIQVGLSQILLTLEEIIVEDFKIEEPTNLIKPYSLLQLSCNLANRELPPTTYSLIEPKLNVDSYNKLFGVKTTNSIFFKNTTTTLNSIGLIGEGSLYSTQEELLPRERLEKFFSLTNFQMDNLDLVIDIIVNNNRIQAVAIFCDYFKYSTTMTQQVINKVEQWLLDN